jgi:glycosyltransferase involved in cell wall biosynthesis
MQLSLHMMVLNGAKVLERALRPLAGIVDEICFTDTGSVDGTSETIDSLSRLFGFGCKSVMLTPESHPELYFIDEQSSFRFKFPSTSYFTGLPQLRDWAAARNKSLDLCQGKYVLRIDSDDEVLHPENIRPALAMLDTRPDIDFLMCMYEIITEGMIDYVTSHHFFWRNTPEYRFKHVLHEHIPGRTTDGSNWLIAQSGLLFRDWRDSQGLGVRIPHRNFKVLLLEYERCLAAGEQVSPHVRLTLADEGVSVDPEFALSVLGDAHHYPNSLGWALYIRGEGYRRMGLKRQSLEHFEQAGQEGELRGMLQAGLLQYELGLGDYQASLRETLRRRQHSASCLIPIKDVQKALHLLQIREAHLSVMSDRRNHAEPL